MRPTARRRRPARRNKRASHAAGDGALRRSSRRAGASWPTWPSRAALGQRLRALAAGGDRIQVIEVLAGASWSAWPQPAYGRPVVSVADSETVRLLDSRAAVGVWRRRGGRGCRWQCSAGWCGRTQRHTSRRRPPRLRPARCHGAIMAAAARVANLAAGEGAPGRVAPGRGALCVHGARFRGRPDAGANLDRYIRWVQQVLARMRARSSS